MMRPICVLGFLLAAFLWHSAAHGQTLPAAQYVPNPSALAKAQAMSRLGPLVTAWLPAAAESQELVEVLRKDPDQKVSVSLLAAQIAVLRGEPTTAIGILDGLLACEPQNVMPGFANVPVAAVAALWRGTIARYHGDFAVARDSYERVLAMDMGGATSARTLHAIANLYLAEIDQTLGRPPEVIRKRLKLAADAGLPHHTAWANYLLEAQATSPEQAHKGLKWDASQTEMRPLMVMTHMTLSGMLSEAGCIFDGGDEMRLRLVELAAQNRPSQTDRALASFALAYGAQHQGKTDEAMNLYRHVLESEGFLAPDAGVFLLYLLKGQGKEDEFRKVSEAMVQRFPGYAEAVKWAADKALRVPR